MVWTSEEFDAAAAGTKINKRTLDACRDVLVMGVKAVDAAQSHDVLPPHISRAKARLEERREELRIETLEKARTMRVLDGKMTVAELMHTAAREAAQNLKGAGWIIREPLPGQVYEGLGVIKLGGYFVQDVGRVGVIHDISALAAEPGLGKRLEIRYPQEQGEKAKVEEISPDRGTRQLER